MINKAQIQSILHWLRQPPGLYALLAAVAGSAALATYLLGQPQSSDAVSTELVEKISSILELPAEQPTIATVTNLDKLAGQPFFARAQVGDKVLLYDQADKIILYRPSVHRVIEVAALAQQR